MPLTSLILYGCQELKGNIKDLPQSITDLNLVGCKKLEGTTLALASCPELVTIDTVRTKIVVPIPIDKQHAFVQELAGGTLTEETITEETKDAFLKFIAYDSNAGALQSWLESKPWLAELVAPEGHEAVQLASAECRKVIADQLYFMGRYKLTSGPPEHKSMTSVVSRSTLDSYKKPPHPTHHALGHLPTLSCATPQVIRAIDYFPERQDPPSENQYVVFKFMINLLQFLREKSERVDNKLEPEFGEPAYTHSTRNQIQTNQTLKQLSMSMYQIASTSSSGRHAHIHTQLASDSGDRQQHGRRQGGALGYETLGV
mmetsp:Transcript_27387/g.47685  ORF Transcript_27387/g.47685 Transcript_27387/m.47685 type:complete len:315 (+) Transcript_27387:1-945(+)